MFLKFTNSSENHKGSSIYINKEWIVAIYEIASQEGGSLKTIIWGGPTGISWEVEESLGEVIKIIEGNNGIK